MKIENDKGNISVSSKEVTLRKLQCSTTPGVLNVFGRAPMAITR